VVDLDLGLALLWLFGLLLGFEGGDGCLEVVLALFEVFGDLIGDAVAALSPVVDELVEADDAALVLLSHVVGDSGPAHGVRTDQNQVKLVSLFNSWGQLYLQVIESDLLQLLLKVRLLVSHLVPQLRDLLLSLLRDTRRRWRLLFKSLVRRVIRKSLLISNQTGHRLINLLNLSLDVLGLNLNFVSFPNTRPELAARLTVRQEDRFVSARSCEILDSFDDFLLVKVLLVKVKRVDLDRVVHRVDDLERLN